MVKSLDTDVHLYLVDDDELLLKILTTKFQHNTSYKIFTFTNANDFINFYKTQPKNKKQIHILIIDYLLTPSLPDHATKNGIDYYKEAKSINPDLKTILISAVDKPELAILAQKEGIDAFIKKNENAFLRINNQVSFIISEIKLKKAHQRSLITRQIFLTLLIIFSLIIVIIAISEFTA